MKGALFSATLILMFAACQPSGAAALDGRVTAVPLPPHARLAVQVCEQTQQDCDRWLYPDANGGFHVDALDPGGYSVAVFLETPNGLSRLTSSVTTLVVGQTSVVELVVPVIPSQPAT